MRVGNREGKPRRTLQLDKIEAITVDTIKVTEYDTFSLRPDAQDMSGMRFHDMYLCVSGLFELKQMVAAAHAGLRGGHGATGFGGSAAPPLASAADDSDEPP